MLIWIQLTALLLLGAAVLLVAWRVRSLLVETMRLREQVRSLRAELDSQASDVWGLAAAGVQIDRQLGEHQERLSAFAETLENVHVGNGESQPYHGAIERVRQGATVYELMEEFGLPQAEAQLLVQLHGSSLEKAAARRTE